MKQQLLAVRNLSLFFFKHSLFNCSIGEKMIYIPRLTSEQSGIYTCIVENSIGKVNQSIYLDVQCKLILEKKTLMKKNL